MHLFNNNMWDTGPERPDHRSRGFSLFADAMYLCCHEPMTFVGPVCISARVSVLCVRTDHGPNVSEEITVFIFQCHVQRRWATPPRYADAAERRPRRKSDRRQSVSTVLCYASSMSAKHLPPCSALFTAKYQRGSMEPPGGGALINF